MIISSYSLPDGCYLITPDDNHPNHLCVIMKLRTSGRLQHEIWANSDGSGGKSGTLDISWFERIRKEGAMCTPITEEQFWCLHNLWVTGSEYK